MAPLPASRWCRCCPPVALVALAFVALASLSDKLADELKKLIVESAALASNGDPLIFDAPNELIVGAADIENLGCNVGKCVCRLHPSKDRHLCLSPTCRKCRPDTSATFCYVG
jgi:hypothetical protein